MRTQPILWMMITLLMGAISLTLDDAPLAAATHDPTDFTINASFSGWNSTSPPVNPVVTEFRGVAFTATIEWVDDTHNFVIYSKGTTTGQTKLPTQPCVAPCIARSDDVDSFLRTRQFTFTPTVPADDNTGLGGYEYFCEYHPFSMHGMIQVLKSPDLDKDGKVTINDIAEMALRFDTKVGQALYMASSDLDNDGDIDINDIAVGAFYFDRILVD